jgi:uncharacterized protein
MGWEFALAEFIGGPLMLAIVAMLFRILLSRKLVREAKEQADKGIKGIMEGHAEMACINDMTFREIAAG